MKYQVEYSEVAIRDLDRVWNEAFEASKDFEITQKYVDDLMDKGEAKADHPKSGAPLYFQDLFTGYYFVVFKAYMAFYRIDGERVLVDRVLFRASDYMIYLHLGTGE